MNLNGDTNTMHPKAFSSFTDTFWAAIAKEMAEDEATLGQILEKKTNEYEHLKRERAFAFAQMELLEAAQKERMFQLRLLRAKQDDSKSEQLPPEVKTAVTEGFHNAVKLMAKEVSSAENDLNKAQLYHNTISAQLEMRRLEMESLRRALK